MRTLLFVFIILSINLTFAQNDENRTPARSTEASVEDASEPRDMEPEDADERDSLIQEIEDLRTQLDEAQQNCNCDQQKEEYVSEREQIPPVVIINQTPPVQEQPQQEVAPPVEVPQFNNNQYSDGNQYLRPNPEKPVDDFFMLLKPGTSR